MILNELLEKYPSVEDMRVLAHRRMPHFAWEYLDSGTGLEIAVDENRKALDRVQMLPKVLKPAVDPDLKTTVLQQTFDLPFGIAPIGMTGLMWPGAEKMLAATAKCRNIPYCLSTVACETIEDIGEIAEANAWFQLYTFGDWEINVDLLKRAKESGFSNLLITVDVPAPSMRERQRRAGLRVPPKVDARFLVNVAKRPAWARATAKRGKPAFRTLEKYVSSADMQHLAKFVAEQRMGGGYVWNDIKRFRDIWEGPITIKGIMDVEDAQMAVSCGVDAIVVSNHGGRQFDAAPPSITVLPDIVQAVKGKTAILFDSGVRGGLDIMRAIALGADFVLLGRPFIYGAAAMAEEGANHIVDILEADLKTNMTQVGLTSISDLRAVKTVKGF